MRRPCFDALEVRLVLSVDIVASVDDYASGLDGQYTTLNTTDNQVYTDDAHGPVLQQPAHGQRRQLHDQ